LSGNLDIISSEKDVQLVRMCII